MIDCFHSSSSAAGSTHSSIQEIIGGAKHGPGKMQLTRMLRAAQSHAMPRVICSTAPLVEMYVVSSG